MTTAKVVVVIQARASSKRFPRKVLRPLCGRPMLLHVIERLKACTNADAIWVATSTDSSDDATAALAEGSVHVYRGGLDDVGGRMIGAAETSGADAIVRISGDSPLIDPRIVSCAIDLWRSAQPDLVTNVRERTFPKGQSVEVIATAALKRILNAGTERDREHVTTYFYRYADRFRMVDFRMNPPCGDIQMSVDLPKDFERISAILERLGTPYERHGLEAVLGAHRALHEAAA